MSTTQRILTPRELNRATLARQMLLGRENVSPLEAVGRLVALQAQVTSPPYVGLWSLLLAEPQGAEELEIRFGGKAQKMHGSGT